MNTDEYLSQLISRFNNEIEQLLSTAYPSIMKKLWIDPTANINMIIKKFRTTDLIYSDISDDLYLMLMIIRTRFLTDWMVTRGMEYSFPSFQYSIDPDAWMKKEEMK